MRLNLGCGRDVRHGYVNVDFSIPENLTVQDFEQRDLSELPWTWDDESADEIMMLDFLEHFPYRMTSSILGECWRILKPGGRLIIQVPDFEHCARAAMSVEDDVGYMCNRCGNWIGVLEVLEMQGSLSGLDPKGFCTKCGQARADIEDAAIHRLYGGQDRRGNWHFTAFTKDILVRMLIRAGFSSFEDLEVDHQYANWNFKTLAIKDSDGWEE